MFDYQMIWFWFDSLFIVIKSKYKLLLHSTIRLKDIEWMKKSIHVIFINKNG